MRHANKRIPELPVSSSAYRSHRPVLFAILAATLSAALCSCAGTEEQAREYTPLQSDGANIQAPQTFASVRVQGLVDPKGVTIDDSDTIYVVDDETGWLTSQAVGRAPVRIAPRFHDPDSVTVDQAGDAFVSEPSRNRIKEIFPNAHLRSVGQGLDFPMGLAADGKGHVFVADAGSGTIKQITLNGGGTRVFASGFALPTDVAIASDNMIYVSDAKAGCVYGVKANGKKIKVAKGFKDVNGIAVDRSGNLWVADTGSNTIFKYARNGTHKIFTGFNGPTALAVDSHDEVFIAESKMLVKLASSGSVSNAGIYAPYGVAVSSDGATLFFCDPLGATVYRQSDGGALEVLGAAFFQPVALALSRDGSIYVADRKAIYRVKADGTQSIIGKGFKEPSGVATDTQGNVYVSDTGNNRVKKVAPNGSITTFKHAFLRPLGLAVHDGSVYVTEQTKYSGLGAVLRIAPDGSVTPITREAIRFPTSVSLDRYGDIFVADPGTENRPLIEITSKGQFRRFGGGFQASYGLSVTRDGSSLFVGDTGNAAAKTLPL